MTDTAGIPGDRIRSFIERVEHIDEEIKALNEGKKEVFAEAKGEGFDVKVLREILRLRKQDKDERDEQESLLDLYLRAMESAGSSQAKGGVAPTRRRTFGCITRGCGRSAPKRPLSRLYRLEPAETANPTSANGQLSAEDSFSTRGHVPIARSSAAECPEDAFTRLRRVGVFGKGRLIVIWS